MNTLLLTGYNERFEPLGSLTTPLMELYAARHGYQFQCFRDYPASVPPLWTKLLIVRESLKEFQRVIWMDADIMITNQTFRLDDAMSGIHVSQDWGPDALEPGHFSCGAYAACQDALGVFNWACIFQDRYANSPFGDQDALRGYYESNRGHMIHVHPRRYFNAVPSEVSEHVVDPWKKGDWLAHLTMIPLADRVGLFHKIHQLCVS